MAAPPSSPTPAAPGQRSGGRMVMWGIAFLLVAVGMMGGKSHGTADTTRDGGSAAVAHPAGKHLARSSPTRLLIPKIDVDAPFSALPIEQSGQLQAPPMDNVNLVGWYAEGASPGEAGTAIIAGHVDTTTSAAVFARLEELKPGDHFTVDRADGKNAEFVVDSSETFEKDDFPSRRVYADTPRAEARLITCAGNYDHEAKDYTENLVVFAHLV
ncbi:class F sortase [Streptomyces brasiliensis]|uniref:Class F sortase n=1 Tax=Streptomyces brasiliensis TaxID=1954 RepID=A0A917K2F0_9ACTN|nr:class F sortase [Streptomyces brasiliensis]GGI96145.1 class F sortase [Streptomyces brasiliensis]